MVSVRSSAVKRLKKIRLITVTQNIVMVIKRTVINPGKLLCYMFLLVFLVLTVQNPNRTVRGLGHSNINCNTIVHDFEYGAISNHASLSLTMYKTTFQSQGMFVVLECPEQFSFVNNNNITTTTTTSRNESQTRHESTCCCCCYPSK